MGRCLVVREQELTPATVVPQSFGLRPTEINRLAMAHQSVYVCLVGILASFVVAVNAGPVTTEPVSSSVSDDTFSSAVPYEFPDDYSISLEQAVVS